MVKLQQWILQADHKLLIYLVIGHSFSVGKSLLESDLSLDADGLKMCIQCLDRREYIGISWFLSADVVFEDRVSCTLSSAINHLEL